MKSETRKQGCSNGKEKYEERRKKTIWFVCVCVCRKLIGDHGVCVVNHLWCMSVASFRPTNLLYKHQSTEPERKKVINKSNNNNNNKRRNIFYDIVKFLNVFFFFFFFVLNRYTILKLYVSRKMLQLHDCQTLINTFVNHQWSEDGVLYASACILCVQKFYLSGFLQYHL